MSVHDSEFPDLVDFQTGVDLSGLMAVLSEHLYSTSDVAVRELVQNAHDSIVRRRMLTSDHSSSSPDGCIDVTTDHDANTFSIRDNGSGLTVDEVHRFLATVGSGATGGLRQATQSDELIGMFGLGFLSVFVVADVVTVTTTSVQTPDETWQYISTDGHRYTVLPAPNGPVGTVVSLQLKVSHSDLANRNLVQHLLRRYCKLLAPPIRLDNGAPLNLSAPWRLDERTADADLDFAKEFEDRFEPIASIPLSGSSDGDGVDGVLWVHGGSSYANADNRRMSVFLRGMLLADDEIDLLPRWAGFTSGVVESSTLHPTASRESLQKDTGFTETQLAISEALVNGLTEIARNDHVTWQRILDRHNDALLGAAIGDERLFELLCEHLMIPTSTGSLSARSLRHGKFLHLSLGAERGFEEVLFRARGVPIARGDRFGVIPFLRKYADKHDLITIELGSDDGNAAIFELIDIDAGHRDWLESQLAGPDERVYPALFEPETIPVVVIPDREAELKQRLESDDLRRAAGAGMAALAGLHAASIEDRPSQRVYVNMACPTMQRLLTARHDDLANSTRAITFLRTLKIVMAATDSARGGHADINTAFSDTLNVIDGLLLDSNGDQP